jgi:mono/diheme cytochrome c family protein
MTALILCLPVLACPPYQQAASYSYGASYSYAAPAYTYATQAAYYTPVVKEIQFVSLAQPYYGSAVGGYAREAKRQEALEATLEKLTERLELLSRPAPAPQQYQQPYFPAPQAPAKDYPVPAPQVPPSYYPAPQVPPKGIGLAPQAGGYGPGTSAPTPPPVDPTASYSSAFPAALGRCARCHTGGTAQGGMMIFDSPGHLAPLGPEDWAQVDDAVASGRMPKGGPSLSLAEYRELAGYIRGLTGPTVASGPRNPF